MRIRVERSRCQGHAMCFAAAPELFTIDELGYTELSGDLEIDEVHEEHARLGARACPERAITIVEDARRSAP
jgi:ferredoxin